MDIDDRKCEPYWNQVGTESRLDRQLDKSAGPNGCWLFLGYKNEKGYGRLRHKGKKKLAHRVAFELANGGIDESLLVLHACDNPPCCNPAHLSQGTHSQNALEAVARGRKIMPNRWINGAY